MQSGDDRRVTWAKPSLPLFALVLAVTGIVGVAPRASANNFGSICDNSVDCVSQANNAFHSIRYKALSDTGDIVNGIPGMAVAADHAIAQYDATDMTVYRDEGDSYPDLWIHDYNYGASTGWVAITRCPADNTGTGGSHPNRWCRGQQNIFNSHFYWYDSGVYDDQFQRRKLTCHEMGHTVALRHNVVSTNSCIWAKYWETTGSILHAHDIAHINARW